MLMEVRNEIRAVFLSLKYALQREMLNKVTFLTNVILMILNNASFILQWIILYSIKNNIGGYSFKKVMILWGIAAITYGVSRFFFINAFDLSDAINKGKLDNYILMPKNILLSFITSKVEVSALGDMLYGLGLITIIDYTKLPIFIFTGILGGLIITSVAIIYNSLAFYIGKSDTLSNTIDNIMTSFATYPEGIFKGAIKVFFYTIIPLGISNYLPVELVTDFNIYNLLILIGGTILFIGLAFTVFYCGLKKYSGTNLMNART